jgi:hypothetical protein
MSRSDADIADDHSLHADDERSEETQDNKQPTTGASLPDEMVRNLREFIDLCEQIKGANDELAILKERKNQLQESITQFMVRNSIPRFLTPNGKINLCEQKSVKPLNKEFLKMTISSRIDSNIAHELSELAFSSRPVTHVKKIRVIPKRD